MLYRGRLAAAIAVPVVALMPATPAASASTTAAPSRVCNASVEIGRVEANASDLTFDGKANHLNQWFGHFGNRKNGNRIDLTLLVNYKGKIVRADFGDQTIPTGGGASGVKGEQGDKTSPGCRPKKKH